MGALDSIPKEAGGQEPGSTWLSSSLRSPHPSADLAKATRRAGSPQELGVEQGACGGGSARSISGRCKISRNLRKRLEYRAAIGPPRRGLGRAGEGRREEVDGKYEGVVWKRAGLSFSSHPCQHSFFLSYQKSIRMGRTYRHRRTQTSSSRKHWTFTRAITHTRTDDTQTPGNPSLGLFHPTFPNAQQPICLQLR